MPHFTLIKHADSQYDSEIKMEFDAEVLDLARAHYEDFLTASGFVPVQAEESIYLDWNAQKEDDMWNDAFSSKFTSDEIFNFQAAQPVNDGIHGAFGADIIHFPTSDQ